MRWLRQAELALHVLKLHSKYNILFRHSDSAVHPSSAEQSQIGHSDCSRMVRTHETGRFVYKVIEDFKYIVLESVEIREALKKSKGFFERCCSENYYKNNNRL